MCPRRANDRIRSTGLGRITLASRIEATRKRHLAWGSATGERADVGSVDEVDRLLDRLERDALGSRPFIVELVLPDVGTMAMGVGFDHTVLSYIPASGDPPYLTSLGANELGDDLDFSCFGEWTEFPARCAVSTSQGRAAMRQFARDGALTDDVMWQEV
jgi:hypothetical protein